MNTTSQSQSQSQSLMQSVIIDDKTIYYDETHNFIVEVGRYNKGSYKPRYSFNNPRDAVKYYRGINIGYGYKKRLVHAYTNEVGEYKRVVIAKAAS